MAKAARLSTPAAVRPSRDAAAPAVCATKTCALWLWGSRITRIVRLYALLRLRKTAVTVASMADRVSAKTRSKIMSSVGTRDTGPELMLRKKLHRLGYRYVTNYAKLPGRPDLVFPRLGKVIFVHGCFWHGHSCRWGRLPKSRPEYWKPKIATNRRRDRRVHRAILRLGWEALTVWQCHLRDIDRAMPRVLRFLRVTNKSRELGRLRVESRKGA